MVAFLWNPSGGMIFNHKFSMESRKYKFENDVTVLWNPDYHCHPHNKLDFVESANIFAQVPIQIVEYSKRRTRICCILLEFDWHIYYFPPHIRSIYGERKIMLSVEFFSNFCHCTKPQVKIAQTDGLEVEYQTASLSARVRFPASTYIFLKFFD